MEIIGIILNNILALFILFGGYLVIKRVFKHLKIMKLKSTNSYAKIRTEYNAIQYNINQIKGFSEKSQRYYNENLQEKEELKEILDGLFLLNKNYFMEEEIFDYTNSEKLMDNFLHYEQEVLNELSTSNSYLFYKVVFYIYSFLIFHTLLEKAKKEYRGNFGIETFYTKVGTNKFVQKKQKMSKVPIENIEYFLKMFNFQINEVPVDYVNKVVKDKILTLEQIYINNSSISETGYLFIPDIKEIILDATSSQKRNYTFNFVNMCTLGELEKLGMKNKDSKEEIVRAMDRYYELAMKIITEENAKELKIKKDELCTELNKKDINKIDVKKYFIDIDIDTTVLINKKIKGEKIPGHLKNLYEFLSEIKFIKHEIDPAFSRESIFCKLRVEKYNNAKIEFLYTSINNDFMAELYEYESKEEVILVLGDEEIEYIESNIEHIEEYFQSSYLEKYISILEMIKRSEFKIKKLSVIGIHSFSKFIHDYELEDYSSEKLIFGMVQKTLSKSIK